MTLDELVGTRMKARLEGRTEMQANVVPRRLEPLEPRGLEALVTTDGTITTDIAWKGTILTELILTTNTIFTKDTTIFGALEKTMMTITSVGTERETRRVEIARAAMRFLMTEEA